jgi:multicomponent Na+:H+ antiporter subunit E
MLIGFGVICCACAVLIAQRMDIVDHEGHPIQLGLRVPLYWLWLGWQMVKSNIYVMGRILSPVITISPTVVRVTVHQKTDVGIVTYANSITLTPGTVSMRVDKDQIDVHALTGEIAEDLSGGDMDRHVVKVEGAEP